MSSAAAPLEAPATAQQRYAVVVHLRACGDGLEAAARRLEAIPQVRAKVRSFAIKLRTTAGARRVPTAPGPSGSGQSEADQHGVNSSDAGQSGSNDLEGAHVSRPGIVKVDESGLSQQGVDDQSRSDAVADRLDAVENRLDAVENRLDAVENRLDAVADRLDAVADRLDAVADRIEPASIEPLVAVAAGRLGAVADQLKAVADRLEPAVADQLEPASIEPLVAVTAPPVTVTALRAARVFFHDAAKKFGKVTFVLSANAASAIEAAADEVKDTVARLSSARRFRDCAKQLSNAARHQLPAPALELCAAAVELERVIGVYPTPPGQQPSAPLDQEHPAEGKWDAAVFKLRCLAYQLQNELDEIKNVRLSLTEADADILDLRLVEQIRNIRGDILCQLYGDYPPTASTQISNLLDIERDPSLKKAQEVWLRKEKDLSKKVVRRETASADVRTQIYNIIGWYAVYLGVVLTAVTQLTQSSPSSSTSLCEKRWFPILLTVVGTIIIIIGLLFKFRSLNSLESTIHSDRKISAELQQRILRIEQNGLDFDFTKDVDNKSQKDIAKKPYWHYFWVLVALLALAASFIISYLVILCNWWKL